MTWTTPLIAGLVAAVAVPSLIILYFLKLRRRDVEISTTLLWKKAIQDLQANAPFQKLRRNILLLLQLLVLAAAILALAQPEWRTGAPPGQKSVILIDRSASMQSTDESDSAGRTTSRLDKSKREAVALIDSLREPGFFDRGDRDEAMVIAFDAGAEVVQAFTSDKQRLRAAIDGIQAGDGPSSLDEAARLAGAYAMPTLEEGRGLVSKPGAPIYLWSDGRIADASQVRVNPDTPITYRAVGKADAANVGITALRAERAFDDPGRASIFVGVQSTDRAARQVDVEFAVDGVVSAIRTITLPAAAGPELQAGEAAAPVATGGVVFDINRSEGALIRMRLLTTDVLAADNEAWLSLSPARRLAVLYVSAGPTFVRDALESQSLSRLVSASPDQFQRMLSDGRDAEFDVVVLDGWAPEGDLPPGRYLVFGALPGAPGVSRSTAPESPGPQIAVDWSREHSAMRAVSLENLFIYKAIPLQVSGDARVVARSDRGPIIAEATGGGVRAIIVAFNVMETNWVWDYNLVLFVGSAVRTLGGDAGSEGRASASPGGTLTARLPADAAGVLLTLPDGSSANIIPSPDGRVTFGPVRRAGLYRLRWSGSPGPEDAIVEGRPQRVIAANLLDPLESDVAAATTLELASRSVESRAAGDAGPERRRRLWTWLLLGALAIIMLEWFIYNRKVYV